MWSAGQGHTTCCYMGKPPGAGAESKGLRGRGLGASGHGEHQHRRGDAGLALCVRSRFGCFESPPRAF
ncbi:uncharacterized protein UV8b_05964 [Ustilaginoidea virens]|uniref:Uncharacterized protein n=1 Tax=Ustilaginoidea virens TaxID=1159556 RepID=A0A8E5MJ69_USTVR|nr:uncharacterized protein UV8b_05964 [Ustilaginoidea virens]QUC21721.1 hypothetical protein UV8b_05964 [Ustilaginoidea virens]